MSKGTLRLNQKQQKMLRQVAAVALAGLFLLLLARTSSFTGQTYRLGSSGLTGPDDPGAPVATPGGSSAGAVVDGNLTGDEPASSSVALSAQSEADAYRQRLESVLEATLAQVQGAGQVEVFLTLADDGRLELMGSETREVSRTDEKEGQRQQTSLQDRMTRQPQVLHNGQQEEAVVTRRVRPEVAGVLVVADGAGREDIRLQFVEAVATALGIAEHRVAVLPRAAGGGAGTGLGGPR